MSPCQGNLPLKDVGPAVAEGERFAAVAAARRRRQVPLPEGCSRPASTPLAPWDPGGRAGLPPGQLRLPPGSEWPPPLPGPAWPGPCGPAGCGGRTVSPGRPQEALGSQSALCPGPAVRSNVTCCQQPLRGEREPGESPEPSRAKAATRARLKAAPEELQN